MRLKYIVTDSHSFAIFSAGEKHSDVARGLDGKPIGAGFCTIAAEADSPRANVHCFGESFSLGGLKSRGEDEQLINRIINSY
jgi:hypothetical protein